MSKPVRYVPFRKSLVADTAGATAVEFAFVAPILILLLFGIIAISTLLATMHGLQQLASEAARASVAGIDETERGKIVADFIKSNAGGYAFLEPAKITTSAATLPAQTSNYEIVLTYDNSGSFIYMFRDLIPLPPPTIRRSAVVVRGGY